MLRIEQVLKTKQTEIRRPGAAVPGVSPPAIPRDPCRDPRSPGATDQLVQSQIVAIAEAKGIPIHPIGQMLHSVDHTDGPITSTANIHRSSPSKRTPRSR